MRGSMIHSISFRSKSPSCSPVFALKIISTEEFGWHGRGVDRPLGEIRFGQCSASWLHAVVSEGRVKGGGCGGSGESPIIPTARPLPFSISSRTAG